MLHVIFIILKIIGVALLGLLALFLLLVGIILLVPVRYRVYASKCDIIQAKAKASWLFRIISLRFKYNSNEETYSYCLRIFGLPFIDSNRQPKEMKEKDKRVKKVKKVKKIKKIKKIKNVKKDKPNNRKDNKIAIEKDRDTVKLKDYDIVRDDNKITKEKTSDQFRVSDAHIEEKEATIYQDEFKYADMQKDKKDIIKPLENEHTNKVNNIEVDEEVKESFFSRVKKSIKSIFQRVKDIFRKIRNGLNSLRNTFTNIKAKIHLIKEFLEVEDNRKGIGRVYAGLKKTLKHILPYKVKGFVRIGLEDPCGTGYLLGALSMVYPIYANKIQIIPDFQQEVLEGQVEVRGRIRAFTLLIIGIKLILDDNFKTLLKNVKELKEEL